MSRVTAAFVCALCDPDNPRPASIMCSNNCGRYVCAVHAVPRKGPGSAMICQSCAEALGLIDRPRPKPAPEVRPLLEIPTEPEPVARPNPQASSSVFQVEPFATPETTAPAYQVEPFVTPPAAEAAPEIPPAAETTIVTPPVTPPPAKENIIIDSAVPIEPRTAARLTDTEPAPAPKSAASETVVSQRGNTLQVPKVSPALGKPPQPIAPKLRKAQRTNGGSTGSNLDWQLIGLIA